MMAPSLPPPAGRLASRAPAALRGLRTRSDLQPLWAAVRAVRDELPALAAELCEVPAPTFQEDERAKIFAAKLSDAVGGPVERDETGNRWAELKGVRSGPRMLVAAHLDTVFPPMTDCRVRRESGRWFGPGLGDNCAGLAVLLVGARLLRAAGCPFSGALVLAGNVCEEGLGDLRGMRALCDRFGGTLDGVLALDGSLGSVACAGVGSYRYRIGVRGPGGHSWSDFGRPSAVHQLARVAAVLTQLSVPVEPRTTYNIGTMSGGTSVNSIAAEAELLLDLRSVDQAALEALDREARARVECVAVPDGLALQMTRVGERPAGDARWTRDWVDIVRAVAAELSVTPQFVAMSSDANIPMARAIRATALGIRRGGETHTKAEWVDPGSLVVGLEVFLLTLLAAMELFPDDS